MSSTENDNNSNDNQLVKSICPSIEELTLIKNQIHCSICQSTFFSESQYRMHDLKSHKNEKLNKVSKENTIYHCPIENCVYAVNKKKHFKLYKYLKQHFLKVHAEKLYSCSTCKKNFSTNAAKEAHVRICGTNFICECQKIYTSYEALLTHARRKSHKVDEKYKSKRLNANKVNKSSPLSTAVIYALPKQTCDIAVQTEEVSLKKSKSPKNKNTKNQICRQTQTNNAAVKEKQVKKTAETQTAKTIPRVIRVHQVGKRKKISINKDSILKEDISYLETLSSEYLLPDSPLPLRHDIILQDLWEEPIKNIFTFSSGTQTSPEKDLYSTCTNYNVHDVMLYHKTVKSDPMLTEKIYTDRFNSIETQTEEEYCRSIFETDQLSSNTERQTTENFTEAMEPLIYNDTYTQTCDEILSSDLVLSDIQTQTAWSHLDDSSISAETQSKVLKCASCSDSTNHMETQTIFEDLR